MTVPATLFGHELASLFSSPAGPRGTLDALATSPEDAIENLALAYGERPSASGHNISDIVRLKDSLYELNPAERYVSAMMCTAPHTHWKASAPTIVSWTGSYYIIGPRDLEPDRPYYPISFAWSAAGFQAYEWADDSVGLTQEDVIECIHIIDQLGRVNLSKRGILGISLNFRFKSLFDPHPVANIENPMDVAPPGYREASRIDRVDLATVNPNTDAVQVSWSLYSDLRYKLTPREQVLLSLLRGSL
jgi:hypothetical protein